MKSIVGVALIASLVQGPPGLPGASKVIETDGVIVWNIDGVTGSAAKHDHRIEAIEVKLTGEVRAVRPGDAHAAPTERTIVIEIKAPVPQTPAAASNLPRPFPRQDAMKVLENERVIVWDVRWVPERPVPAHTHDRDVVSVTIEPGELKFTAGDGSVRLAPQPLGGVVYVPRGNSHREESVNSSPRAIIVELK